MTTLLDEPPSRTDASAGRRLRDLTAAVRLSFTWFGTRKTLTPEQKAQAADTFGAEGEFLSAGKKLIDTKHPDFKAVTGARGRIVSYWRGISLPYPEPGIRLVRQDDVGPVNLQLTTLKADLEQAVHNLDRHFASLKSACGACSTSPGTFHQSSHPPICSGSVRSSMSKSAAGSPPSSTRPCVWPSRSSCRSCRSWSRTSPNA
jgi:hypothetical protein